MRDANELPGALKNFGHGITAPGRITTVEF